MSGVRRPSNDMGAFWRHVEDSHLDPHPQYTAETDFSAHVAASDPHPGYRLESATIQTADIADSAVTTAKIANDAVTSAKIANDAITAAKIAADAVGSSEIAASAVGSSEIADSAVTNVKVNFTASTYTPAVYSSGIPGEVNVGSGGNAYKQGRYMTLGKLMWIHIAVGFGTGASAGASGYFTFGLPSGITAAATREQVMTGKFYNASGTQNGAALIFASTSDFYIYPDATPLGPASHGSFGDGYNIFIEGMLEIA